MINSRFPIYLLIFILTFVVTAKIERFLIPRLKNIAGQPIYTEGPKWHIAKAGTPTMGGLAFLIAITFSLVLGVIYLLVDGKHDSAIILLSCTVFSLANSIIGIIDDLKKLKRKQNQGLKASEKIILQTISSILFLLIISSIRENPTELKFTFGDFDIGILYYPLSLIILLGITNCANLTDGIDGLASGVAFAIGVSLFYISYNLCYEVCFIAGAIMGGASAFLIFNLHPAKIFMGDTGSLFFGALIASAAIAMGNPLIIIFIGGIYVIEGLSVIIQVIVFKLTGKRVFKMSPVHHHFERCGWSENKICIAAIILTFIFSVPAFIVYLT